MRSIGIIFYINSVASTDDFPTSQPTAKYDEYETTIKSIQNSIRCDTH